MLDADGMRWSEWYSASQGVRECGCGDARKKWGMTVEAGTGEEDGLAEVEAVGYPACGPGADARGARR